MKFNYKPAKLTKEEQQEFASIKSTLPYVDRLQIEKRTQYEVKDEDNDILKAMACCSNPERGCSG